MPREKEGPERVKENLCCLLKVNSPSVRTHESPLCNSPPSRTWGVGPRLLGPASGRTRTPTHSDSVCFTIVGML